MAIGLALVAGVLAATATFRGVQAHGSFSALFGERDGGTEDDTKHVGLDVTAVKACPQDMAPLSGDPDDRFGRACIDKAEYPGWMETPEHGMSFVDAQKICAEAGRRLCTTDEWRRACGGLAQRDQPYGDEYVARRCKTADSGDQVPARSGQRSECVNALGVVDLVGNVSEWVAEGVALGGSVDTRKPSCFTQKKVPNKGKNHVGLRCCMDVN